MSLFNTKHKHLLLVQVGYLEVEVSLLLRKAQRIEVLDTVHARKVHPYDAVRDCLEQLRQRQKQLPRQVILVSREAVSGWLNLSIPANIESDQVEKMLRWELEGNLDSFASEPTSLGLLECSEYLDAASIAALQELQETTGDQGLMGAAVERGILQPEEAEAIEGYLEEWPNASEDYVIAWSEPTMRYPREHVLVSALPQRIADEWVQFFAEEKLFLLGTLAAPLISYAQLDPKRIAKSCHVAIEGDLHQVYADFFNGGNLVEPVSYAPAGGRIPPGLIDDLLINDARTVSFTSVDFDLESLNRELAARDPGRQLVLIDSGDDTRPLVVRSLESIMSGNAEYPLPELKIQSKRVPLYEKTSLYWLVAVCLLGLVLIGLQWNRTQQLNGLNSRKQSIEEKVDAKEIAQRDHIAAEAEAKKIERERVKLERELYTARISITKHDTVDFYTSLLRSISDSLRDEINLEQISVDNEAKLIISGSSLNDQAVHEVLQSFHQEMSDWDLLEQVTEVRQNKAGSVPYSFSIKPKIETR
jgi:hypothetical protein